MLSADAKNLLYFLAERDKEKKQDALKPKIGIKSTVGFFAFVYEKIRNLVDYQEEHLLLRRAITRILIRRAKNSRDPKVLIQTLITELLMARYLENDYLPEYKLGLAEKILEKYFALYQHLGARKLSSGESFLEFLLSLAAREIEENFIPSSEDQLLNFTLKKMEKRVVWKEEAGEEEARTRLLVGLMRALAKYDDRTVYYKLWKLYFPGWIKADKNYVVAVAKNFSEADGIIRRFLSEPQGEFLVRVLKKHVAPFEILGDLINRGFVETEEIFSSEDKLARAAELAADSRYLRAKTALRRGAINSFIYIFITKMIFALAVEIPYELYLSLHFNFVPLLINLLFPPSLMLFMALTVESPTRENTRRIVSEIQAMTFGQDDLSVINISFAKKTPKILSYFFKILYGLVFVLVFGLTLWLLKLLNFSVVSIAIFFFFLSTVTFFAFRIRSSFKELVVGEDDSNIVSNIFDFFLLPFVRLGRAISTGLREINIFTFFFDIVLEAPFKTVLEVIEEWTKFLKEKKEETLNVIK